MKATGYLVLTLAFMAGAMNSIDPPAESVMPMLPTSSPLWLPTDMVSSYADMDSDPITATAMLTPSGEPAPAITMSMAVDSSGIETSSTGTAGMSGMSSMSTVSTESMGHHMGTSGMMPNMTGTAMATATGQQPPISAGISVY